MLNMKITFITELSRKKGVIKLLKLKLRQFLLLKNNAWK